MLNFVRQNRIIVKKISLIFSFVAALLLVSCGEATTFTVEGKISDVGVQNMRAIYYADGAVNVLVVPVKDGAFEFEANATEPTMVELFSTNKVLLGRGYVYPGDNIECVLYKSAPYKAKISGNEISERWSKFLLENSEVLESNDTKKINVLVESYINSNKTDLLSTLLLLTEYVTPNNEPMAAKLLAAISPDARPQSLIEGYEALLNRSTSVKANEKLGMISFYSSVDSLKSIVAHSSSYIVVAFSDKDTRNEGEIIDSLRALRERYHNRRLQIADISLDIDTTVWKKSIKNDSATWQQGWVVGAVSSHSIDRLGINRLPFYIVADSTGKQLYRGTSIIDASNEVNKVLKNKSIQK